MQGGSWCIPRLAAGIPGVLSTSGALAPRHMAAFALAAHAKGVALPAGKFQSPKETLTQQWQNYVAATCGSHVNLLSMSMAIECTEKEARVVFSAQSNLNTFRLKPVITKLNDAFPGLGWLVYDAVAHASDDDFPIYNPMAISGFASHLWFYDCWDDEEMLEEIQAMDEPEETKKTVAEMRKVYDHPWPSDLVASVDGHGWMLGAYTHNGKRQLVGYKKPKRASLKDARAFTDGKYSKDLQAVVADALALLAAVRKKASAMKGCPFRPRAGDFGQTYMDDDDPLVSIGATCFVVWDSANFSWEAASHFEEYEMNGGECTEAFYVLKADPTNRFELEKLVTSTQEIVKRYALVSRLLHHFDME